LPIFFLQTNRTGWASAQKCMICIWYLQIKPNTVW
jgi:hypothetical protein